MTQANESLGLTAYGIHALNRHAGVKRIFDYALVDRTPAPPALKAESLSKAPTRSSSIWTRWNNWASVLGDYLEQGSGETAVLPTGLPLI